MAIEHDLARLLALPGAEQLAQARELLSHPAPPLLEAWNSRFGEGSLFEAWCRTSVARSAHAALRAELAPVVARPGFVVVEVGGGNGAVWRELLRPEHTGTLVVVDPVPEACDQVRQAVPPSVEVVARQGVVQHVQLPDADAVVCSLTLHHVAGRDAAERAAHGLTGPGKLEVLQAFREAIRPRDGVGLLVEADVDCEVDLPVGDPRLAENLLDSYVRRCARGVLADLSGAPPDLAPRLRALLRHWFLGQLAVADLPMAERDVYELTVPRWLELLDRAGLAVERHGFTDELPLFHLYRFRAIS